MCIEYLFFLQNGNMYIAPPQCQHDLILWLTFVLNVGKAISIFFAILLGFCKGKQATFSFDFAQKLIFEGACAKIWCIILIYKRLFLCFKISIFILYRNRLSFFFMNKNYRVLRHFHYWMQEKKLDLMWPYGTISSNLLVWHIWIGNDRARY